jgi:hypothetical protein
MSKEGWEWYVRVLALLWMVEHEREAVRRAIDAQAESE